ncbi:Rhodanese-related sulfurtransferase [Octadecabacter temperatus]|uniref:Rhodanese-like domain protein n=1 Tax=Octadecabacter temperatus TaxID=1458307 RepID=A0A0K0Y162_9RHOB|nr:rhodanese-like domain-containing protein [Octadecabacter temperatus]AKS44688.1 Rhodanese-like domain protein [Octadecabacter temperatus]SIO36467.1 Rhodanese-related sulfurtransferase [Octadecabacter temperatus]
MNYPFLTAALCIFASTAMAQDVRITTFKSDSSFTLNGQAFTVTRDQNTNATLRGEYALTSRACPPHCLQPLVVANGVNTFAELEVLTFLEGQVTGGTGLLIDARAPADYATGSIPGSVNVPLPTLAPDNRFRTDILRALGAVGQDAENLDFSQAMALAFYSGGPWSDDAPTAIESLLAAGYPAEKLFYFRGGIQAWAHAGLTIQNSQNPG